MKFEGKMSGISVTDFHIDKMLFSKQLITLSECLEKVKRQETMNWILDTLRFYKCEDGWYTTIDWDSIIKLSILEYYPKYENEFIDHLGEDWIKHYIRFNH